ncbi:MAG: zinc-binding dehydrogenase [Victivallales bacterium]|nr:zinc-binding dehydrogenase [Victivallales bacterium]
MNKGIFFTGVNTAELLDVPMPEIAPGHVLVKVYRTCISSGTERANLIGTPDNGVGIFTNAPEGKVSWPRRSGYSSSGVVEAVGEGVEGFKPGDRVAMSWTVHQQYVCIPATQAYLIPENISFEAAALTHISTFPMAAVRKCRLEIGESAIVMGQGILGQLAIIILKAAGATPIIAADPLPEKRAHALELGADFALDPTASDFAEQAKTICSQDALSYHVLLKRGAPLMKKDGPKVGIEVTGVGKALDNVLDAISPFGRIALLGCTRNSNFSIDYYHKVHGRGVTLIGAHALCRNQFEDAPGWWTMRSDALTFLRLQELGRISLEGFVAEVHSPEECGEVYARLAQGSKFPVVQFDWTRM